LVRRGAVELIRDGTRTMPGEFVQRVAGERYSAVGETWIYELRLADVAQAIVGYQDRLRKIAGQLEDRSRVKLRANCTFISDASLGGVLVHNERERAVLSEPVARLARMLDGQRDVDVGRAEHARTRSADRRPRCPRRSGPRDAR